MSDETVTIIMPEDAAQTASSTPTDEQQVPEVAQEISPDNIQKIKCLTDGCDMSFPNAQEFEDHTLKAHMKPQRNEKGQFVEGNTESVGNQGGRPCEFCQKPVEVINKVNLYREWCRGNVDGKLHIPYLEELVSEDYLDVTIDQFEDWVNPANHKEQHAELTRTVRKLMTRQKLLLLKRTLGDNPRGAMFQLSANHGVIEKAGRVIGGDPDNKLEIVLTEERKLPDAE